MVTKLYRYEEDTRASFGRDINGEIIGPTSYTHALRPYEFDVDKETEKGYWVLTFEGRKWISKYSIKRYAYPSKKEALEAFIYRKKRQVGIMENRLGHVKHYLALAKELLADGGERTEAAYFGLLGII